MFNPLLPEVVTGKDGKQVELKTGMFTQPNGDIVFRIYAPNAQSIEIDIKGQENIKACILQKGDDGIFEGVYPYNPDYCGPHSIDILVDGAVFIYPYIPIVWQRNKPVNFIEVPDPETTYININNVPHGAVTREIYWSKALNTWERCMVYTPPGYQKSGTDYPVLYLQHGMTENETCWEYNGRVSYIMDNLIAEGKCVPFIIVMNDGMARLPEDGDSMATRSRSFEKSLIESCIPFIEDTYRVKTDKWSRAIAGLSMGSTQAFMFGLGHPELFGSIGIFSGAFTKHTMPQVFYDKVFNPEFMGENFSLFMRTIGDEEGSLSLFNAENEKFDETGVSSLPCYKVAFYAHQTHEWGAWRRAIHDFAQLIFR